jgi:sarcosine oxidase
VAAGVKLHLASPDLTCPDRADPHRADQPPVLAGTAVVAAGAWLAPLLDRSGLTRLVGLPRLTVTQEQAFHFPVRDRAAVWPIFLHHRAAVTHGPVTYGPVTYGLPAGRDGTGAVKIGEHFAGPVTTADTRTGVVDPAARQRVTEYVRRNLPGLDPVPAAETTCLYTSTDNEDFVIDRVGPLVICSPCSGHGAKFAPLIGELAADLATGSPVSAVPPRFGLAAHRPAKDGTPTGR